MASSKSNNNGYECPVRGCPQRNNMRFMSIVGLVKHMEAKHEGEAEKRLRAKRSWR